MNNQKNSSTNIFNQRTIISGRLKRPSKDLPNIGSSIKKPFLKEYSTAMEQKLQHLKDQINEKKKYKNKDQPLNQTQKIVDIKLSKFLNKKNKTESKNVQQIIQDQLIKQKLHDFLAQNNLLIYKNLLFENQIDSLQILAEATQKELEEIGIPKGHSLKLKVNIAKLFQNSNLQQKYKLLRQTKTKDSQRNKSFVETSTLINKDLIEQKQEINKKVESICIGTQQDGIELISFNDKSKINQKNKNKSKFCLFCYLSIKNKNLTKISDFCSQDCQEKYNQMFKKYQNNLIKAEHDFKKPLQQQQTIEKQDNTQVDQKQDINQSDGGYDFLDQKNQFYQDFDYSNYEQLKKQLQD